MSTMLLMILDALWTTTAVMMRVMTVITNDNNNNEYISKGLNPSMCDLHETQSAVRVQLKAKQTKIPATSRKRRRLAGEGANSKY